LCNDSPLSLANEIESLPFASQLSITSVTTFTFDCKLSIICCISSVDCWVRPANERTSSATTAKPRPCSPARAASIAAFSASKLVCSAIPLITSRIAPMESLSSFNCATTLLEFLTSEVSELIDSMVSSTKFWPLFVSKLAF